MLYIWLARMATVRRVSASSLKLRLIWKGIWVRPLLPPLVQNIVPSSDHVLMASLSREVPSRVLKLYMPQLLLTTSLRALSCAT